MMATHDLEHMDLIRVRGQSHTSFDDAVARAIKELACPKGGHNHHPNLTFQSFDVVSMSGKLHHEREKEACEIIHYDVVIEVSAIHDH